MNYQYKEQLLDNILYEIHKFSIFYPNIFKILIFYPFIFKIVIFYPNIFKIVIFTWASNDSEDIRHPSYFELRVQSLYFIQHLPILRSRVYSYFVYIQQEEVLDILQRLICKLTCKHFPCTEFIFHAEPSYHKQGEADKQFE